MEDHMRRLEAMSAAGERAPAHRRITPLDWFSAEVQQLARRDDTIMQALLKRFEENLPLYRRALDDVTGYVGGADDASGLTFPEFIASQIVDEIDTRRPLFASFGSFPLPRSGVATIPVVTQRSLVAARSGQKQEANSRAVKVVQRSFTAEWYDGALDVALELIATAELSVLAMLWDDLLGQYALATEAAALAWFEDDTPGTGRTWGYHGNALPVDTYANFVAAVAEEALNVRTATTAPATRLAVTETQWPALVAMVDSTGRRHLATVGGTNADASAGINAESFVLPTGIVVFPVPGLTYAALYNERAVRAADGGPMQVQATNVAKMGRDIGVLGRTLLVDRIPAGVRVFAAAPDGGDNGTPDGT